MKKIAWKKTILTDYKIGMVEALKVHPVNEAEVEVCLVTQEAAVILAIREAVTIHTLDLAAVHSVEAAATKTKMRAIIIIITVGDHLVLLETESQSLIADHLVPVIVVDHLVLRIQSLAHQSEIVSLA